MKPCCIFSYNDAETAYKNLKRELIKEFDKRVYNTDGSIKHYVYVWDKGGRSVVRCKNCGAFFIYQWTVFYDGRGTDIEYEDYCQVETLQEAETLHQLYSGLQLPGKTKGARMLATDYKWEWDKRKI